MISLRSLMHAKRIADYYGLGPPERLPNFIEALNSKKKYILVLGRWVPFRRKKQSEETKKKISQSMKGKRNHVKISTDISRVEENAPSRSPGRDIEKRSDENPTELPTS